MRPGHLHSSESVRGDGRGLGIYLAIIVVKRIQGVK